MGIETAIAWTDHTFNPWIGCAKVSEGCRNCYALAVKLLADDNRTCGDNWPAGQSWDDLGGSSKSVYLHRARELAGIPHADFLAIVRADSDAIEDIYERGSLPPNVKSETRAEDGP